VIREHGVTDIVHFAAYKSAGESMEHPGIYWQNNVQGTVQLLEAAVANGVQRIVFSSSAAVYGNPTTVPVDETAPLAPENVYAETKSVMEQVIEWYGRTHGVHWASLRYFNAAGAADDGSIGEDWSITTNLIPLVMKAALGAGPAVRVLGDDYPTPDGTGVRDYVHVEDLAAAHVAAVDHLQRGGESVTLNLGTGRGSSVMEVLRATERVHGAPVPHEIVARRVGDPAADSIRSSSRPTAGTPPAGESRSRVGEDRVTTDATPLDSGHDVGLAVAQNLNRRPLPRGTTIGT
jgi:UDP-glucose-4-epimerase GalE